MIQTLNIKRFRSLQAISLVKCGRVNLLLGRNNSGKTAILEALLLLFFPPNPREVLTLLNEQRGYKPDEETEEMWGSLFYDWDPTKVIVIDTTAYPADTTHHDSLALSIQPTLTVYEMPAVNTTSVIHSNDFEERVSGLTFKYRYEDGDIEKTVTSLQPKGKRGTASYKPQMIDEHPTAFIPARGLTNPQVEAERFSRLEKAHQQGEVVEALKLVEPRLKRLTVLAGGKGSMIYGDIGGSHLIPVSLMGDGMVRMLSMAMTMVNTKGGLVLIDEIENGLHYSVLPGMWKMIFQTAQKLGVQVFAATHSDECIHAASQTVQTLSYRDDLRLYRLDIVKGKTVVTDYSANELATAIASEQEVR